jgi:hypothetical protein
MIQLIVLSWLLTGLVSGFGLEYWCAKRGHHLTPLVFIACCLLGPLSFGVAWLGYKLSMRSTRGERPEQPEAQRSAEVAKP